MSGESAGAVFQGDRPMPLYPQAGEVQAMAQTRRFEEASLLLEQSIKSKPTAAALNDLALVSAALGRYREMLDAIQRAMAMPDANIMVKVNQYYLTELSKLDRGRGENALERVVDLKRGDPELKPRISVIIRTYNRAEIIRHAVQSVLDQQFKDWELVIVNDGGDREVDKILQSLWDKRMVYAYARHSGNARTFNVGLRLARGDIIGFLDDDYILYPEHLQRVVSHMDAHPDCKAVYTDLKRVWMDGKTGAVLKEKININQELQPGKPLEDVMNFLAFAIRRECLDRAPGFLEGLRYADDWEFAIALRRHFEFEYLPGIAGEFRFRKGLERVGGDLITDRRKEGNLILYAHGASPFYSFGPARGKISRRFFLSLDAFLLEFPQMVQALELKKFHKKSESGFFYFMAQRLEKAGLLKEAGAAYKYSALLSPFKIRPWKNLIRIRMQ